MTTQPTEPKAEQFVKNEWDVPLVDDKGRESTYRFRASWDPEKVELSEIATCAGIQASKETGIPHAIRGDAVLLR